MRLVRFVVWAALILMVAGVGYVWRAALPSDQALTARLEKTTWAEEGMRDQQKYSYRATFHFRTIGSGPDKDWPCKDILTIEVPPNANIDPPPEVPQPLDVVFYPDLQSADAAPICAWGTWRVFNGHLERAITGGSKDFPSPLKESSPIVTMSARELVYNAPLVATDPKGKTVNKVLQLVDTLSRSAFRTPPEKSDTVPPSDVRSTLLDRPIYVPRNNIIFTPFEVPSPSELTLKVDIVDATSPLDVLVLAMPDDDSTVTNVRTLYEQLKSELRRQSAGDGFAGFRRPEAPLKIKAVTEEALFDLPLSKRGVYRSYEAPAKDWPKGRFVLIFDNSGDYTPSRGDAPTKVKLTAVPTASLETKAPTAAVP